MLATKLTVMKRIVFPLLTFFFISYSYAQETRNTYVRKPALAISFFFNDYVTANRIRTTSLSSVIANKQKARLKEMDPGIAVSYFKGLSNHIDLASTLAGSFVEYTAGTYSDVTSRFLLEGDVSLNFKLFSEKYFFTPYAILGAGISKYGPHYGAFIPTGVGLKVNLVDEAHIFLNSQYRIPVTPTTANYHFMHSIGIAGVIGTK
jgi:OmpA-OmpF porin, OOP family